MTGYNNQNQQLATVERAFQAAVKLQIMRESDTREVLLITALFLQTLNVVGVITPQPDIQSRPRQMYCKRSTP
jgi:hypothetical protein